MSLALQSPKLESVPGPLRRFTVDEYHRMIESGVLAEGEPIELLEGWLATDMTRGARHDSTLNRLIRMLLLSLPPGLVLRGQSAITTTDSEPEPDVALVAGPDSRYEDRHPSAAETHLVIEVADASLERDREIKSRIYASARIPEYWIVNVRERRIEVLTNPVDEPSPGYQARREFASGQSIPISVGGAEVARLAVSDLMPA